MIPQSARKIAALLAEALRKANGPEEAILDTEAMARGEDWNDPDQAAWVLDQAQDALWEADPVRAEELDPYVSGAILAIQEG